MIRALALLSFAAAPAWADVDAALDTHVLPGMVRLAETTAALVDVACDPDAAGPAFAAAAQAWAAVSHLTLGPAEEAGRGRAVLFWPEERDATGRALRLLEAAGQDAWTPEGIARASVAARGLGSLERLIFEDAAAPCPLTRAVAGDLAATADAIADGWTEGFAETLRTAGEPGNTRFLAPEESEAALFTALLTGLEADADTRLGEPLGTFERPRPGRAELHRSGQSLAMLVASLEGLRELAAALADAPRTDAAIARALELAARLDDPAFAGVEDTAGRFRVEALQTAVRDAYAVAAEEIGAILNVTVGFNSKDGD